MASVPVTSANTNSQLGGARVNLRNSAGIPYVIVLDETNGAIQVWKGNSTTPTAFTEQDSASNPQNTRYVAPSACIDSTDIIHIAYYDENGKTSALRYVTFDTSTDTFSGDISVKDIGGATPVNSGTAISIDTNDIPHIAWVDSVSNMGTDYDTVYYVNRVGGAWNTEVEIEGGTATKNCAYPDIAIDSDNVPIVVYRNSTDSNVEFSGGNINNASSFTLFVIDTIVPNANNTPSVVVDSTGDIWVGYIKSSASNIALRKHVYGNAWTTWGIAVSSGSASQNTPVSLVATGTDIYFFFENSSNDIAYDVWDGTTWAGATTLETGTFNTAKAKWAFWVDNDNGGALTGLDTYYFDGTPSDPDSAWTDDANAADGNDANFANTSSMMINALYVI